MFKVTVLVLVCFGMAAADFSDDFESFSPGDDISSSLNWDKAPVGGEAVVIEQSDNKCVNAVFSDSSFIGYVCTAAGFWADGSVAMDFSPSGTGSFANVYARLNILSGDAYAAGLTVFMGTFTYQYIAYITSEGTYELLYSSIGPQVSSGEWANVKLQVEGTNPVTLTLYINDEQVAQVVDTDYLLQEGICGFALYYEGDEPSILMDNFEVIANPLSLAETSFGALKAIFR